LGYFNAVISAFSYQKSCFKKIMLKKALFLWKNLENLPMLKMPTLKIKLKNLPNALFL